MKYEYSFETKYLRDGEPILIMRLPPHLEMLTSFLFAEVHTRDSSAYIFSALDNVITGTVHHYDWAGNIYGLDITPTLTMITNEIDPDGEHPCEIETGELREIIDLWLTENERLAK